jgi:hypothetical protein
MGEYGVFTAFLVLNWVNIPKICVLRVRNVGFGLVPKNKFLVVGWRDEKLCCFATVSAVLSAKTVRKVQISKINNKCNERMRNVGWIVIYKTYLQAFVVHLQEYQNARSVILYL